MHTAQSRRCIVTRRSPLRQGSLRGSLVTAKPPLQGGGTTPAPAAKQLLQSHRLLLRRAEMHNIHLSLVIAREDPGYAGILSLTSPQKTHSPPYRPTLFHLACPAAEGTSTFGLLTSQTRSLQSPATTSPLPTLAPRLQLWGRMAQKHSSDLPAEGSCSSLGISHS